MADFCVVALQCQDVYRPQFGYHNVYDWGGMSSRLFAHCAPLFLLFCGPHSSRQHLINDVHDEDGPNEVSFRADTGEYDPSFVLCVMFALTFTSYEVAIKIIKFVYETLTGKKIVDNPTRMFQQDCFRRLGVLEEMQV